VSALLSLPMLPMLPMPTTAPRTRAECVDGPRPCPHLGCRYHLAELWGAERLADADTCALDVAERGEHGVGELAGMLGAPDATLSDIEAAAKRKLEAFAKSIGIKPGAAPKSTEDRLLAVLRAHGALGRSELAVTIGLSKPRVTALLTGLMRAGKVVPSACHTWQLTGGAR
jgi:hypothetical protein